ncbi:DNA repair protein RecO [Bacillus sp. V59.32b]|uniref:DNA repair protein RecO n=1 Tax=Bacillus sp. V59.32b TaxID=1758642 RepID=UPI000E3DDD1A|nr:DNA repair protein RecO [Bacillus sp. V59.32b]RFU61325.1 DNA repair protein RecO [Bacillus sp. V59.32b]
MLQKCEGIVIRRTDYGESNKIITIYTREWGKIGAMARGASKPKSRLSAVTQLFYYGYFLVQTSSGLGTMQQGETVNSMRSIREDIFSTAYASYIVELLDKSVEDKKSNPYLFELLYQTLNYINEGYDAEILKFIFEMKMLQVNGLSPTLDQCSISGHTEGEFAFSLREGGFICHRCYGKDPYHIKMSPVAVKLLRLFYYFDLSRLGNISIKPETKKELQRVIDAYYEEYSGLQLKSKKFLNQMDQMKDKF